MCAKGPEIREGKKFIVKLRKKKYFIYLLDEVYVLYLIN